MELPSNSLKLALTAVLLMVLAACAGEVNAPPGIISPSSTTTPPPSPTMTLSPMISPTSATPPSPTPTVTLTPTPGPAWQSYYPLQEPNEILTTDITSEEFQDLIIFFKSWNSFANFWVPDSEMGSLFAFSPDGKRAGSLSPDYFEEFLYFPVDSSKKPIFVQNDINLNHPAFESLTLPPECDPSFETETNEKFEACSNFQFSPDEKYMGFFYGPTTCSRAIMIMNLQTGEVVFQFPEPFGHYFILLENSKALIATGHCEGGNVFLADLRYGTQRELGPEGFPYWNNDRTAFAMDVLYYEGNYHSVWAFNVKTNQLFMNVRETLQVDDHPVWTPNDRYLIYQYRTFSRASYEEGGYQYPVAFDQARQIMLVDVQTGYQQVLLSDKAYDFHLGSDWNDAEWYGDWIQVRRVAFTSTDLDGDQRECRIYGAGCSAPVENFALNWKTGELVPWDEMVQAGLVPSLEPTPRPQPDQSQGPVVMFPNGGRLYAGPEEGTFWLGPSLIAPDLDSTPIYTHPDGLYAYYVGMDGQTLWMVPKDGEPVLWVKHGENFFYLPPVSEDD